MSAATLGVLISGRGSNLRAILGSVRDGSLPAQVGVVISNRAAAPGLSSAREAGVRTAVIDHRNFESREAFDSALLQELERHGVTLVCLAGFMRLLSPVLVEAYRNRILNIHPSLLPAFPGLHAQRQALEYGAKVSGCTVHLVDEHLDHGPILIQSSVLLREDDTEETLAQRILEEEHRIYPAAIRMLVEGRVRLAGRRAHIET